MPEPTDPTRRATAAEVARLAGVSAAVVSYVVNGGPRNVAPATAARVREAVERRFAGPSVGVATSADVAAAVRVRDVRQHAGGSDFTLDVEATMNRATVDALAARGHTIKSIDDPYMDFGSGQFIWRLDRDDRERGYVAASDSRRDGLAAGF